MSVFYINIKKLGYILERCAKVIVHTSCVAEMHPIFIQMSVFYIFENLGKDVVKVLYVYHVLLKYTPFLSKCLYFT